MTDDVAKGLEGVVAAESSLSYVDGENGTLLYRGYDIEDLAVSTSFEEVLYLLWEGSLPTPAQLEQFSAQMAQEREIPDAVEKTIAELANEREDPMAALRTATSMLSAYDEQLGDPIDDPHADTDTGKKITAAMPTILATYERYRRDEPILEPDPTLSLPADFLRMINGEQPSELEIDSFDLALLLHADHGFNASTFTTMVIGSTLADLYAAVTGGIGALGGPLHGGANQDVMRMFRDIDDAGGNPVEFIKEMRERGERVPGFGHRVYRVKDPRAKILEERADELAAETNETTYLEYAKAIESHLEATGLVEKGIAPNLDFYSGLVYDQLGIPLELYAPLFAVSRVGGWIAHVMEYQEDNRLIRPVAQYVGPKERRFVPRDQR